MRLNAYYGGAAGDGDAAGDGARSYQRGGAARAMATPTPTPHPHPWGGSYKRGQGSNASL